jgi:hypothetical protein
LRACCRRRSKGIPTKRERLKTDLHYTNHLEEVREGPIFEAAFVYPKEEDTLIIHANPRMPTRWTTASRMGSKGHREEGEHGAPS